MTWQGTVIDGSGRSRRFVTDKQAAFREALGYDPYPGTLNVRLPPEALTEVGRLPGAQVPDDRFFHAVRVDGLRCHAKIHKRHHLEVVAPVNLRDHLGLATGDTVTVTDGGRAPYQDVWRDGRLLVKGRRDCATRYDAIRGALEPRLGRGFTVADVGGWDGYFLRRLHEDLQTSGLLVDDRTQADGPYTRRRKRVTAGNAARVVGRQDAVLALSVLHHMPDWQAVYEALQAQCRWLVVEVCHPDEDFTGSKIRPAATVLGPCYDRVSADGVLLCEVPAHRRRPEVRRPTFLVEGAR